MEEKIKLNCKISEFATNNPQKFWRIIAILCLVLSIGLVVLFLLLPHTELKQFAIMKTEVEIALSIFSIICCIILIIKPLFFHIYMGNLSVWSLLYIIDGGNTTGFILMTIAMGFAYKAGNFTKYKLLDFLLFFVPTILALFSQLRFDKSIYISSFIAFFGYIIFFLIFSRIFFGNL